MSKPVSIEEPFQLSTYTSSYRGKRKSSVAEHIFVSSVSSSKSKNKGEGLVTVAAQADGIHLVDVSSLHSVASHTLGPSTSFSCPAITIESENDSNQYTTYAVIESSAELSDSEDGGRVIWKWEGNLLSSAAQKQKLSRVIVPPQERLHGIYTIPNLPSRILGATKSGNLLLLDSSSLEEKSSFSILAEEQTTSVYRAFIFPNSISSFGVKGTNATGLVVSFPKSGTLEVHVVSVDSDDELSVASQYSLPYTRESLSDISCSETGTLSVLRNDGVWSSYTLSAANTSSHLRPLARPFKLSNFSFTCPQKLAAATSVSICALTSHHVLLAALSPSLSSIIHIQIWDLQYTVLLAFDVLPIPTAFSSSPLSLKLVAEDSVKLATQISADSNNVRGQAVLVLSVSTPGSKASSSHNNGTSTFFVVPYVVPLYSTLAVALGKGHASKPWLQLVNASGSADSVKSKADEEKETALGSIKSAMENGKAKSAESAFLDWLKSVEGKEQVDGSESVLDYNFVKEVLEVVLPPTLTTTYPDQILKTLVESKAVVSSSMVQGGLLGALRERNDWACIESCFATVVDLPECDIIQALVVLTKHHVREQQQQQSNEDDMHVDAATTTSSISVPSLPAFLSLCINYPSTTSKGLVLALKQWVRDPQDAAAIAQVLERWIRTLGQQRKVNGELGLLPSKKDLEKNEHGVWVVNQKRKKKSSPQNIKILPPLVKVVNFLQSFMDACFLQLLQHTPSHKIVQQLQLHLIEEAAFSDVLEQLRGSLEPFALGHHKTIREAAIPEKEKQRQRQKGDWRQRRNGAPGVVGAVGAIGLYQVEEFVL